MDWFRFHGRNCRPRLGFRQRLLSLLLLCLPWAGEAGSPYPRGCLSYPNRLQLRLLNEPRVSWPSEHLKPVVLSSLPLEQAKTRLREIVDQIYKYRSPLGLEMDRIYDRRMRENMDWLGDYYRAYEMFYFSPRYQALIRKFDEHLPKEGRIIDLGSGTGGLSAGLADLAAGRHFMLVDHRQALDVLADRIPDLFPEQAGRFRFVRTYLNHTSRLPGDELYEGAIINHTLYVMMNQTKLYALRSLKEKLKPGAIVVVNEPLRETAGQEDNHRAWVTAMMEDALLGLTPHTEFDVAVLTSMSSGRMTQLTRIGAQLLLPFNTEAEHEAMFQQLGFTQLKKEITYDGFSRMWVLKAP